MNRPTDYDHCISGIYYKTGLRGFRYWWLHGEWVKLNTRKSKRAGKRRGG